jgi:hypothetical protein
MRRRAATGALVAVAVLVAVSAPTGAQETDISGQVQSTIELSLRPSAPDRVQATVTATVGGTQLSVAEPGQPSRVLRAFQGPLVKERVTVHATKRGAGVTEQTITFGPQGP